MFVIKVIGLPDGKPLPISGCYLRSFDHEADNGRGFGDFTRDPRKAMMFMHQAEAIRFRNRTCKCVPLREDGRPNRPLTAATIEIMSFEFAMKEFNKRKGD
jgi:hypothetical protein